eukprot:TRINITY_DN66577_c0_g1_i1.p1 TRINITY_DN66577_c0_g1~~TRINITY_DN66577_c0_g1_i1.p1  ORF type:complete len:190 (+),score=15.49 TRINITY_DN66577_c0_g1_i1:55-570(+)
MSYLSGSPFEVSNWSTNNRLEVPWSGGKVTKWQLHSLPGGGYYMYAPDVEGEVEGRLVLKRPHHNEDPDKLLTVLNGHRLAHMRCDHDELSPFCNSCLKWESDPNCVDQDDGRQACYTNTNNFSIRTTCPHAKYLTEQGGRVFFTDKTGGEDQLWRLSSPQPADKGLADFL